MRRLALAFVLTACQPAPLLYPLPVPSAATPTPLPQWTTDATPTPSPNPNRWSIPTDPPPYPILLDLTVGTRPWLADIAKAANNWNTALMRVAFVFQTPGIPVSLELFDEPWIGNYHVLADVNSLYFPQWVHFWPGVFLAPEHMVTIEHELGHLLGCHHLPDSRDVMHNPQELSSDLTTRDVAEARSRMAERMADHTP